MDIEKLTAELIRDEGVRLRVYKDTMGIATIGIGRNLEDEGISEDEAKYLLRNDIDKVVRQLRENLPWFEELDDARQRVLCNMCFNLGLGGLLSFRKTLAQIKAGNYARAAEMMLDSRWAEQVGARAIRLSMLMRDG